MPDLIKELFHNYILKSIITIGILLFILIFYKKSIIKLDGLSTNYSSEYKYCVHMDNKINKHIYLYSNKKYIIINNKNSFILKENDKKIISGKFYNIKDFEIKLLEKGYIVPRKTKEVLYNDKEKICYKVITVNTGVIMTYKNKEDIKNIEIIYKNK